MYTIDISGSAPNIIDNNGKRIANISAIKGVINSTTNYFIRILRECKHIIDNLESTEYLQIYIKSDYTYTYEILFIDNNNETFTVKTNTLC